MLAENRYRPLEGILDQVNDRCVRMIDEKKHEYRDIAMSVGHKLVWRQKSESASKSPFNHPQFCTFASTTSIVGSVIDDLKFKDAVFSLIYSRLDYVGSYYDGLRVKEATEFDLNVIVRLPLNTSLIKVENTNGVAGFAKVNISEAKNSVKYIDPAKRVIDKWCDRNGYLQQTAVRAWLEGVFSLVVPAGGIYIAYRNTSYVVTLKKSGPAFTLQIHLPDVRIDVDLVIALVFPKEKRPPTPIRWPEELANYWVLVPKSYNHLHCNILWRISFPASEKTLMGRLYKLKHINRFLKALRDAQRLNLASYYIKTVFLWEAHKVFYRATEKSFWEKNKGFLFVYSLEKLEGFLRSERLPYYWHRDFNLLGSINRNNLINMANQVRKICNVINKLIENNDLNGLKNFMFNLFSLKMNLDTLVPEESSSSFCSLM